MTPTRTGAGSRSFPLDAACADAVALAREAAEQEAGAGQVGEHLGVQAEGERLVMHRFACLDPAYHGWHWAVSVTRASRAKQVTVDEVVLLPGDDALLAPPWVPWSERLRPGDIGPGDLLVTPPDDERLVPGLTGTDAELDEAGFERTDAGDVAMLWELGLGRPRVLSPLGRAMAAERWYDGEHGPNAPIAEAAPASCATCAFLLPMAGSMRRLFGVCANEYAPDDGRVVSFDHGCGAHSEAVVVPAEAPEPVAPVVDHLGYDTLDDDRIDDRTDDGVDDAIDDRADDGVDDSR